MSDQDLEAFRGELRSWLAANIPDELRAERAAQLSEAERTQRLRAWQAQLAAARWVGITWPVEYGGRAASIPQQIAYTEEMARAEAPPVVGSLGIGIAGPPLIAYGTEEQKQRFAHRILTAEDLWCFGFSEPGAGSDLASLRTLALLEGDHFVVNGQKVWTTLAQHADWCMVLCRTDPQAKRRNGISCLLVDMKSPGITVRPLRQISGHAEFNEVFFENVRVPRENLLGELHNGWQIATAALQNERGILYVVEMQILLARARDQLMRFARARRLARPDQAPGARRRVPRRRNLPPHLPAHPRQAAAHGYAWSGSVDHQAALDRTDPGDAARRHVDPRHRWAALRHAGARTRSRQTRTVAARVVLASAGRQHRLGDLGDHARHHRHAGAGSAARELTPRARTPGPSKGLEELSRGA